MQILLKLQYDGTNYAGFQKQKNAITIQEKLENALLMVFCEEIKLLAASRTDAGVHALGQRVSFHVNEIKIPLPKLPNVINAALPSDISVVDSVFVPDDFHPRFDARHKTYTYSLLNIPHPNPLLGRYSVHVPKKLDVEKMKLAIEYFVGKHDFAAFSSTGGSQKTTVREIYETNIEVCENGLIKLAVTGNAFLYNMVRIIAGTVYYAGIGKISPSSISDIILSKKRTQAGKTMPPHGLVLVDVGY